MKYSFHQYKIDTLLKMAKTTSNEILREKYIAEADVELQELSRQNGIQTAESVEAFYFTKIDICQSARTKQSLVYDAYTSYCVEQNKVAVGKQAFYRFLREMGVRHVKTNPGIDCFVCKVEGVDYDG